MATRARSKTRPRSQEKPAETPGGGDPVPVVGVDGNEILMLDAMLPLIHPKARAGDPVAIDQVVKILDLRRKYVLHKRVMDDA